MGSADVMVDPGDYLAQTERYIGGRFSVSADHTNNSGRLSQLFTDHRLFMVNTNFS